MKRHTGTQLGLQTAQICVNHPEIASTVQKNQEDIFG